MDGEAALDRRELLRTSGALASLSLLAACEGGEDRKERASSPNVLIVTADDLSRESTGLHGCPLPDITPNLDALAAAGARVDGFHVAVSSCQPSRSCLMTGLLPHRNGAMGFEPVRGDVATLPELLKARGWLLGILSKVWHLGPPRKFPWDVIVEKEQLGDGRDPDAYSKATVELVRRARAEGRPFFLLANSDDPHRPFPERIEYPPAQVPVPAFLSDLSGVRAELAAYYTAVKRFDATLGGVLRALEELDVARDTLVVCLSDNAMPFPFAKAACYRFSTAVPFAVRWPGRIAPGTVLHEGFASGVDLLPTVLDAVGVPAPPDLDGASLLPALMSGARLPRARVYSSFDATSAGRPYPMRAVHGERYGYVYNAWSDGVREFQNEESGSGALQALQEGGARDRARAEHWLRRAPEELVDYDADPGAWTNLAGDPDHALVREELSDALLGQLEASGDPLAPRFRAVLEARARR